MPYSSYDHDKLEAAETMRIERRIYFEAKDREIAPYASLPIAQLLSMRSESAAAEQAIFDDLKERAAAWEEQAGRTLLLDKTLEYVRTPHVQHTANEWQTTEHNRHIRSNRVYQMNYYIYENTRYDKEAQKSIPYSWTLTWSVRTNSPSRTQAKIAGQDRKVFLPAYPAGVRRLFQSKRYAHAGLHHRGRRTPAAATGGSYPRKYRAGKGA